MTMAGKKPSSALFSAQKATINVYSENDNSPKAPSIPKSVRVEEAENGFIVNCGYDKKPVVAESIEKALEAIKKYFE